MKHTVLAVMTVFMLSGCALIFIPTDSDESRSPSVTFVAEPADTPEPSAKALPSITVRPEPSEEPIEASEEPTVDLAAEFEQALLDAHGITSFRDLDPENLGYWVSGFEPVSNNGVRIFVQAEVTDEGRENYGRWAIQLTCQELPELGVVVVRDTTGIDSNHFRSNYAFCS